MNCCVLKQNKLSSIKEQLLQDFLPDDTCPLGTQFFVTPREIYQCGPKNDETSETVLALHSSHVSRFRTIFKLWSFSLHFGIL